MLATNEMPPDVDTSVADALMAKFRGRLDVVAVGGTGGKFAPEAAVLSPARLAREHLAGVRCLGFYNMDERSRCTCSCIDFDNHANSPDPDWKNKAEQVYFMLNSLGILSLVEISQSGEGAHVWIFFDEPTDAWVPRAFWKALAAELGIKRLEVYPRQDELDTTKGLGNLVRYPLWNQSHFVDLEDDWATLDPVAAVNGVRNISGEDLKLAAFGAGFGTLEPPSKSLTVQGAEGALPLRVAKLLKNDGTLLRRRWDGDTRGMSDASRSGLAMSICCELVRGYVPTPEIATSLRAWLKRVDPEGKYNRDSWVNGTVAKAYDFVTQKTETKSSVVTTTREAAHLYIDRLEANEILYVPSGIDELDASIDGIAPGEVLVLAGRPSHGKSAIAFQWISQAAAMGVKGLIISEEMGAIEIGKRRLQSITRIPADQWVAASACALRKDVDTYHNGKADVYIVESCSTIDRAEEVIDQMCGLYNVGFVAIDYLQLLGGRGENRNQEIAAVSRRIKQAARRHSCCILLLSQLNRSIEHRDDFMPVMSDLRESGGIEQDADLIVFGVYPHRVKAQDFPPDLYRLVCAKRRNGPIRSPLIETTFNSARQVVGHLSDEMPSIDFE